MPLSRKENMTTALIICGALGHEIMDIVHIHALDVQVYAVPAIDHIFPERIAPDVEKKFAQIKSNHDRVIVVFGDCGSRGAVDEMVTRLGLERISGPHCYEWYGGDLFQQMLEEEPGTYFLTDFMVRGFKGTILKGMGLDRYPQLKEDYFRNYKRIVYLAQKIDDRLRAQAQEAADYLELPLIIHETGYNHLENRLLALLHTEMRK
jgi:hypothetical protein